MTIVFTILGIVLFMIVYEFAVRNIPTSINLSFIDMIKRWADKLFPNYHKEDFPFKKHSK